MNSGRRCKAAVRRVWRPVVWALYVERWKGTRWRSDALRRDRVDVAYGSWSAGICLEGSWW